MKIKAYQLHNQAAPLAPAPGERAWAAGAALGDLDLSAANSIGWELRCPYGFEASWNGGPRPEDIHIQLDAPEAGTPPFVRSLLGGGRLSFYPGYQIQTEEETSLWVRGPVNAPKDGLAALEQILDASLLPVTITACWQFTRAGQAVRFAAGEPFAVLLPYPQHLLEQFEAEQLGPEQTPEAYAQEFQQHILAPAVLDTLRSLQDESDPAQPPAEAESGRDAFSGASFEFLLSTRIASKPAQM